MENLQLDLLDDLIFGVINRCQTIRERSTILFHSEFASENPRKLAKLINKICSELIDHLVALRNNYSTDPSNVIKIIQFIDDFVQELGAHLRYIDGAITTKLPWSLPQPLEKLTKNFLPNTTLMLRPQWKYNYSILPHDWGELYKADLEYILPKEKVDEILSDFPTGFYIISFPSIEKTTVLLHCDLGHEIGHLIAKQFIEIENKTRPYIIELQKKIIEKVKRESKASKLPPLFEEMEVKERLESAVRIRLRGLEEILSDIFAMHLLGPAALFALFEMAISDVLDLPPTEASSYYPPWRTRLRYSLDTLEKTNLLPTFDNLPVKNKVKTEIGQRISDIRNIVSEKADQKVVEKDWITKLAYDSIKDAIPYFEEFLTENYGTKFITSNALYEQIYDLIDRLCEGITPNAIESFPNKTKIAKLESILNAAWFYRISYLKEPFPNNKLSTQFQQDFRTLNLLTLKAIEFSYIKELYDRNNK